VKTEMAHIDQLGEYLDNSMAVVLLQTLRETSVDVRVQSQ
jgi:hypothetical protein